MICVISLYYFLIRELFFQIWNRLGTNGNRDCNYKPLYQVLGCFLDSCLVATSCGVRNYNKNLNSNRLLLRILFARKKLVSYFTWAYPLAPCLVSSRDGILSGYITPLKKPHRTNEKELPPRFVSFALEVLHEK